MGGGGSAHQNDITVLNLERNGREPSPLPDDPTMVLGDMRPGSGRARGPDANSEISLAGEPFSRIFHYGPHWQPVTRVASADPVTPLVLPEEAASREKALFGRSLRQPVPSQSPTFRS